MKSQCAMSFKPTNKSSHNTFVVDEKMVSLKISLLYSEHLHHIQLSHIFRKYHNFGTPFLTNHVLHSQTTYILVICASDHIDHSIKHPHPANIW